MDWRELGYIAGGASPGATTEGRLKGKVSNADIKKQNKLIFARKNSVKSGLKTPRESKS